VCVREYTVAERTSIKVVLDWIEELNAKLPK